MPSFWRKAWLIYRKDLTDEFRTTDHLLSTVVFGIMLVFVTSFALQLVDVSTNDVFPAVLWVSIFFMAVLALQRLCQGSGSGALTLSCCYDRAFCFTRVPLQPHCCFYWRLWSCPVVGFHVAWRKADVLFCWPRSLGAGPRGGHTAKCHHGALAGARSLFPILAFPLLIPSSSYHSLHPRGTGGDRQMSLGGSTCS